MNCLHCGIDTINPKFCSRSCSAKMTNLGKIHSQESRQKAGLSLKGRLGWAKGIKWSAEIIQKRVDGYTLEKRKEAALKVRLASQRRYESYTIPLVESDKLFDSKKTLRKYLLVQDDKCRKCRISEWCGTAITLEIHHLDGNKRHNRLSNVTLLCPNCHSQTHNYRNKNRKAGMAKQENALDLKPSGETLAGSCPATSTK